MGPWKRFVGMQGGLRGKRVGIRLAFVAVTLAAVAMLTPIATAHAAKLELSDSGFPGSFGVDSCTTLPAATAEMMPTQFYVAELGAGAYSLNCVQQDVMGCVGQDYVRG